MPTYGYKCRDCSEEFDAVQKISEPPITVCPKCRGKVNRVFHPVGIIFKGSGFYTTDYKRKSVQPAPADKKAETPVKTSDDKKTAEQKTDSKPAEKVAT